MNLKILLAAFAASVVGFFGGWVIFGMLLGDFMSQNTIHYEGLMNDPPILWAVFFGGFSFNLLGAIVFEKWANIRSFVPGVIAGLWIGFLTIIYVDLFYYAFMNLFSLNALLVDVVVNTLFFGLLGGVIGAVLGIGSKSES